ncbi:MAG TPA: twin-arginine translocase subunit TatC [Candidatus Thalassarchaeaceae archaeon]|nr:twin-arginine translocase subunit TatC [Candidatus Thalassarchaeaceae archaeon]HJM19326.1 twin-arginine translocase subunit TatC [Candidatus Thalassarchaeaceae archaeon]
MAGDGTEQLARDVESLLESEHGELLLSVGDFVRLRIKRWALIFFAGMMIGYPAAGHILSWLINTQLIPDEASIVILQPLEIVIIQLRLASHLAVALVFLTVIVEAALLASKNEELKAKIQGVEFSQLSSFSSVFLALLCSLGLAAAGIWYVIDFLLPLLLDYLQADAASIGVSTTWQLSAWIGFIAGLCLGAAIGFQVPLITLIALRGNLVTMQELTNYRKHLWFAGFCAGAMLSPPDPLSMFLVAGPMLILFEISLIIDRILP